MRLAIARECYESDVLAAGALDIATADDALAVGEQSDFEQQGRRKCRCPCYIIVEAGIKTLQIQFVVEQVLQCVFKSARQKLPLQVHSKKPRAGVNVFVTRHLLLQNIILNFDLDI